MFSFFKRLFQKNNQEIQKVLQKGAIIIDVRTKEEYEKGHVSGSKNIPLSEIKQKRDMIKKWNRPIVTVCRSGSRSAMAKEILQADGIEVYNGGAWNSLPTK